MVKTQFNNSFEKKIQFEPNCQFPSSFQFKRSLFIIYAFVYSLKMSKELVIG
jgi:hypothetical protein